MATIFQAKQGQNQGQQIALGWSMQSLLKDITALIGTDGHNFMPVDDRGLYSSGAIRQLSTAGILYSGLPTVGFYHPTITDGQIATLKTYRGNVTIRHHIEDSVGKLSVQTSNALYNMDLNQLQTLKRQQNQYVGFISNFVIVEVI